MNIKFEYLYRDGANYKNWGSIVFSNPENMSIQELDSILRQSFEREEFFMAHQLNIDELFFFNKIPATVDDHCYHEYYGMELTDEDVTDHTHRLASEFANQIREEANKGWEVFDPINRIIQKW